LLIDPQAEEAIDRFAASDEIPVILKLKNPKEIPSEIRVVSEFGDIVTARIRSNMIRQVRNHPSIKSLKAARFLSQGSVNETKFFSSESSDFAKLVRDDYRVSRRFTGKGVKIGIIDFGIQFALSIFRNADGTTRIQEIWDQSSDMSPEHPNPYGYGRIYSRDEINRALLEKDPYLALGYRPSQIDSVGATHGTVVGGIAAGSPFVTSQGEIRGVATGAELIVVCLASEYTGGLHNLGDSVTALEAAHRIINAAGDSPCVINMSLGSSGGAKDGSSLVVQALDNLLISRDGLACCMSNGNYRQAKTHTHTRLRPGISKSFRWLVDRADRTPNELEIWYPGSDRITISLESPGRIHTFTASLGEKVPIVINGQRVGCIYNREKDPLNGDNVGDAFLYTNAPSGLWNVVLKAVDVVDGRVHLNVERDSGDPHNQSRFYEDDAKESYTLGSICNGRRTIAVGAFDSRTPERRPASFSSCGPTRDGRVKPDCVAPGVQIPAVVLPSSESGTQNIRLVAMSGASMAAPHATGTVALTFEAARRKLSISETRNIILSSVDRASKNNMSLGQGYLNVDAAIRAATELGEKHINPPSEDINIEPVPASSSQDVISGGVQGYPLEMAVNEDSLPTEVEDDEDSLPTEVEDDEDSLPTEVEDDVLNQPDEYELVKIADRFVSSGKPLHSLRPLLENIADARLESAGINKLSTKELFDAFAFGQSPKMRQNLEQLFEVVGSPGSMIPDDIREGDLLLTEVFGRNLANASVIVSPNRLNIGQITKWGLSAERNRLGEYVQVVEGGFQAHTKGASFYRMISDETGRVPTNRLILRMKKGLGTEQFQDYIEAGGDDCLKQWIAEVGKYPILVQEAIRGSWKDQYRDATMLALFYGIHNMTKLTRIHYFTSRGSEYGYCDPKSKEALAAYKDNEMSVKLIVSHPRPQIFQLDAAPCSKQRQPPKVVDNPSIDITGRYYTKRDSTLFEKSPYLKRQVFLINHAGNYFDCFCSDVYMFEDRYKGVYRRNRKLYGDLQPDGAFRWFSRERPFTQNGILRTDGGRLFIKNDYDGEEIELLSMEKRPSVLSWPDPTIFGKNTKIQPYEDLLYKHELFPLTPSMKERIRDALDQDSLDKIFEDFFEKKIEGALGRLLTRLEDKFTWKDSKGLIGNVFADTDIPLVRLYARIVLVTQKWERNNGDVMSHMDWIQKMLDASVVSGSGSPTIKTYLGLTTTRSKKKGVFKYEVTIDMGGAVPGIGGYGGYITFKKTGDEGWLSPKTYRLHLFGAGVSVQMFLDPKTALGRKKFAGTAETYVEWTENDIPGRVIFTMVDGGVAMGFASAQAGSMIVDGDGSLPPMEVYFQDWQLGVPNIKKIRDTIKSKTKSKLRKIFDFITGEFAILTGWIAYSTADPQQINDLSKKWRPKPPYTFSIFSVNAVHFCLDDPYPTKAAIQYLRMICATKLFEFMNPETTITIVGHADTLAMRIEDYNKKLAKERAQNTLEAIKLILKDKYKINPSNEQVWSFGDWVAKIKSGWKPVADPEQRRADIYINSLLEVQLTG
jgi:subtilisin family serine protease